MKNNTPLQPTVEQRYLGLWTTSTMNFSSHCHKVVPKQIKFWVDSNAASSIYPQHFYDIDICPRQSHEPARTLSSGGTDCGDHAEVPSKRVGLM